MAGRGVPPKPTALKVLKGVRPARINRREPSPRAGLPAAPRLLTAEGRVYWLALVRELGPMRVLSKADGLMLAVLANTAAEYEVAEPGSARRERTAILMHRLARDYGLTPSARSLLVVPPASLTGDSPEALLS